MTNNEKQPTAEYLEAREAFLEFVRALARWAARRDFEEMYGPSRPVNIGEIGEKRPCPPPR